MPEAHLETTPHFSRGGPAEAAAGVAWLLVDLALPAGVFLVALVSARLLPTPLRSMLHPAVWFAAAALLAGAVFWNRMLHAVRTIRRANDISSLPFAPDPRHRVRVICWPDEADTLRRIRPDAFEPERFRAFLPDARVIDVTRPATFVAYAGAVPGLMVQIFVLYPIAGLAIGGVALMVTLFLLRMPTYCRFSPRRLEIIRFAPLSTREVHRQTFSLTGPVTISTKGLAQLSWTDAAGKSRRLPFVLLAGRNDAVQAAIAAAISQADAPEPESL